MKGKGLRKASVEGSFWEFISKIVEKAGALAFTIIIARFLLPEGFGAYSLAMAISLVFIGFINFAIDGTMIRYVSDALGKGNKKLARDYFKYIFRKKILASFISAFLLLILAYPLSFYGFKKPFLFPLLFISGFYIFVLAIESSYSSLFYIFKKLKAKTIKEVAKQTLRILLTLLVFFLVAREYYIHGAIIGLILTNLLVLVFVIFYIKNFASFLFDKQPQGKLDKKRIMRFLSYLLAGGITGAIFSYVDILMLGAFLPDTKYIGFYSAAVTLTWGIANLLSFNSVFLPIFTQIKKARLEDSLNAVLRYSFMMTLPMTFGIVALSNYIIFLVYGIEYLQASIILSLMAFLIIEFVNESFITTLFFSREKPKSVTKITIYSLFLNITLSFVLIKTFLNISQLWALIGAVFATLISRYTSLVLLVVFMKKKLNIKIKPMNWVKPLFASIIMFLILLSLNKFFLKDMTLSAGIVEVILGALVYLLIMLLIRGVSIKDLNFLKDSLSQ